MKKLAYLYFIVVFTVYGGQTVPPPTSGTSNWAPRAVLEPGDSSADLMGSEQYRRLESMVGSQR